MRDQPITILPLEIPLQRPFATASGTVVSRSVALVRLGDGPYGWGEAAPYPGQDESMTELLQAADRGEWTPTLVAAIDEAAADHRARMAGESLAALIGVTRGTIPVSLAVGLYDPIAAVTRAVDRGVSRFKLKIAPGHVGHVAAIRSQFPDVVIGVDANGSFDSDTIGEIGVLSDLAVTYLEQPVADFTSKAAQRLRDMVDIPVFADESVRSVADAEELLAEPTVGGVVVKPGRLGWSGALAVREMASAAGKKWRASGLLETGIGRAYTDLLAACPDAFVSDVAPAEWFLEIDVTGSRFQDGEIILPPGPGIGIEPSLDLPASIMSGVRERNIFP